MNDIRIVGTRGKGVRDRECHSRFSRPASPTAHSEQTSFASSRRTNDPMIVR